MKNLGFIGKLIFALPFVMFGVGHFTNANAMAGMVPSFLPAPVFWVYLTGLAHLLAVVAIVINKKAKLAALLLGIMLLLFAFLIHFPGFIDGNQMSTSSFLKDFALGGAALFMSSVFKD